MALKLAGSVLNFLLFVSDWSASMWVIFSSFWLTQKHTEALFQYVAKAEGQTETMLTRIASSLSFYLHASFAQTKHFLKAATTVRAVTHHKINHCKNNLITAAIMKQESDSKCNGMQQKQHFSSINGVMLYLLAAAYLTRASQQSQLGPRCSLSTASLPTTNWTRTKLLWSNIKVSASPKGLCPFHIPIQTTLRS